MPQPTESHPDATRQRKKKWLLRALFAVAVVLLGDAFFLEPNWIEVTHHQVRAPLDTPLRIAHLTDVHVRSLGYRERRLLNLLADEKPDVIVITGDFIAAGRHFDERAAELLSRIHAPLGVWMVRGNWENSFPEAREYRLFHSGATLLQNRSVEIRPNVWLVGVDEMTIGHPDLGAALTGVPPSAYKIALFHAPLFFEQSAGRYDLALAGHTHGGQIRVPFLRPLILPPGIGTYYEGWFEKNGSRMYVSRGIGVTYIPARFDCRPELAIITLSKDAK